ncbi:MAG TPA: redoxin domain-containing protein [Solirubrobacterales bacterium]
MISVGDKAPDFTLRNQDGEKVSLADYSGRKLLLVFYPGDFSPVCGDQLSIYQEVKGEIEAKGVELVGVSVDSFLVHKAFQEKLGLEFTLLSDFEPKGEVSRAYDSYVGKLGFANRTLVLIDEDGTVAWTHEAANPGEFPGANVIFDALA